MKLAVEAVIEKQGKILITQRSPNRDHAPGEWETVTGRVEPGETLPQAVAREVLEETGLIVNVIAPYHTFHFYRGPEQVEHQGVSFYCRYVSGRLKLDLDEQVRFKWVLPQEASKLITNDSIRRSLTRFIQFQALLEGKPSKHFELVARAILFDRYHRVVLVKRTKEPEKGKWILPGGKLKFRETADAAIVREIKEELNLTFTPAESIYLDDFASVPDTHCGVVFYTGEYQGKIKASPEEITDVAVFTYPEILKMTNIGFNHRHVLIHEIDWENKE